MATKNFAPSMTFTESEVRLPKREQGGATRTGMILTAKKGYANIPMNIRTESQLADVFGYPTETNYKMWFDAAGYLKYASELYIVRPINTSWTSGGIKVVHTSYGTVSSATKANLYNPDIAEQTIDNATTTEKVEFYPRSVSSDDDIAVAICSRETDFTSPIFDEDAIYLHSLYIESSVPVIVAHVTTIATVETTLTHGYTIIADIDANTYKIHRYNKNTGAWVVGDTVATGILVFTNETSARITAANRKKLGVLTWDSDPVAGTFTVKTIQPNTYTTVKDATTNFVSYVVPNYLGSAWYGSDKKPATFEQLLKPTPDWLKYECGVVIFKRDSQGYWQLAETWIGSWDSTAKTTAGQSKFIQNVINKNSNYIYCVADPLTDSNPDEYEFSTKNYMLIDCILATTESDDMSDYSIFASADLETAAETFGTNGVMQPELLIGFDNNRTAGYLDTMPLIANETGMSLAVVSLYNNDSDVGKTEEDLNTAVIDAGGNQRDDTSIGALTEFNSYTFFVGQMKYFYDKYSDKYRWVPVSGDIAGMITQNDTLYGVQSALAGYNRGTFRNYAKMFTTGTYDQDELSKNGINQIVYDHSSDSYVLFEFITNTQLDLIVKEANIRRMIIYIKQFLKRVLKGNYFEFNNEATRTTTLYKISAVFEQLKKSGGLFDYVLICDETNNTAEKINNNEFVLDIRLQPNRLIKFITVNITNYDIGINIQELSE